MELACRKRLKNHKSVEIPVKNRDHMCSAESPQVRKVNTNSQRETGESGCRPPPPRRCDPARNPVARCLSFINSA